MLRETILIVVLLQTYKGAFIFTNFMTFHSKLSFKISSQMFCEWFRPFAESYEDFAKIDEDFQKTKNVRANISEFIRMKKPQHTNSSQTFLTSFLRRFLFVRKPYSMWPLVSLKLIRFALLKWPLKLFRKQLLLC